MNVPRGVGNNIYVFGETDPNATRQNRIVEIDQWGMTLTQALGEVKGTNAETADPRQIYVMRERYDDQGNAEKDLAIFHLDASDPRAYVYGDRFVMQPRDVIHIGTQPITNWSRFVGQILPNGIAGLIQPAPYILN